MRFARCQTCGAFAVWEYAPADGIGEYCDNCVPRGCSCNRPFNEKTDAWDGPEKTDDLGRLLPCCEYWYMPVGFEPTDPAEVMAYRTRSEEWARAQIAAQGIEAGTAETTQIGSVHESPVANGDAPIPRKDSPNG